MVDAQIVDLYWQRSESAIENTSQKYGSFCKKIAKNILYSNEDADECVNDTYLRAWNSIPPNRPDSLRAFLGRIVRNVALDRYKRYNTQKRKGEIDVLLSELAECIASNNSVENDYEEGVIAEHISDFLRKIDKEKRILFVRRYWYAEPISVLSKEFHMSESKLTSLMLRLRLSLRKYLEEKGVSV